MKAMILAAGRGERMRPLTDRTPKPLLPVAGTPLIVHQLRRLRAAGINELVINTSWLGQQLRAALGSGERYGVRIAWSDEPEALETAGGIVQALPLLGEAPFLVINGDVWCEFDPAALPPLAAGQLGRLLLVDNPAHNPDGDFVLTADGEVRGSAEGQSALTFAGISLLSPALFAGVAPGRHALKPLLDAAIAQRALAGTYFDGYWLDVGTPERLAALEQRLSGDA